MLSSDLQLNVSSSLRIGGKQGHLGSTNTLGFELSHKHEDLLREKACGWWSVRCAWAWVLILKKPLGSKHWQAYGYKSHMAGVHASICLYSSALPLSDHFLCQLQWLINLSKIFVSCRLFYKHKPSSKYQFCGSKYVKTVIKAATVHYFKAEKSTKHAEGWQIKGKKPT